MVFVRREVVGVVPNTCPARPYGGYGGYRQPVYVNRGPTHSLSQHYGYQTPYYRPAYGWSRPAVTYYPACHPLPGLCALVAALGIASLFHR